MSPMAVVDSFFGQTLEQTDVSSIPAEPSEDLIYRHRVRHLESARALWSHRDIIYTLAERDFRAQYKQASLGIMWALLSPLLTLLIMMVVFSRVKTFGTEGLPYALFVFVGILCWSFFSGALSNGGQSLLSNKALMAKTQFPRECFPLETMCVNALNTVLSWVPLAILFVIFGRAPAITTLWVPVFILIEIIFAAGICMAVASIIIQMRDLMQVLPIITSLGLFATPVIWPLSNIPSNYHLGGGVYVHRAVVHGHVIPGHWVGGIIINLQMVYGFFNPLGPVIDGARRTMLLGLEPQWNLVGVAALGAVVYLTVGYRIFKRLEVNFADIA
jgi:ABC-type polysaccharide/polyol phosphate export permease